MPGCQQQVIRATAEGKDETLPDDDAIEEVMLGVRANRLVQIIKDGRGHDGCQRGANYFRQGEAREHYAENKHTSRGHNTCGKSGQESSFEQWGISFRIHKGADFLDI